MNQKEKFSNLIKNILTDLAWGPVENWNNYDFDRLSELIYEKTDTRLSSVTLKRVLGKLKYDSQPSAHTLNTLAQFKGYQDWRDFSSQTKPISSPKQDHPPKPFWSRFPIYGFGIGIGIILVIAITIATSSNEVATLRAEDFKFDNIKVGSGLPSSVIFRYDASKASSGSTVEIQQSWDERRSIPVSKGDSIHTSIYYYPGFYEAKLIIDDKVVQRDQVFIPSIDWISMVEQEPTPMYVSTNISKQGDSLGTSPDFIKENGFQLQSESVWTNYSLVRKFPVFSDEFTFSASLKNAALGGVNICKKIELILLFEGEPIIIPLALEGCVADLYLFVPGSMDEDKSEDLSMFGIPTENWVPIQVVSQKETLSIAIAGQVVKTLAFTPPPSRFIGCQLRFEGTGWVKEVQLNGESIL